MHVDAVFEGNYYGTWSLPLDSHVPSAAIRDINLATVDGKEPLVVAENNAVPNGSVVYGAVVGVVMIAEISVSTRLIN